MSILRQNLWIRAPVERCFDLSRSVDLHMLSAADTHERAIGGITSGLMGLGDEVIWQARHFGVRQHLHVRITAYDRPHSFTDSQVRGAFGRFDHMHTFSEVDGGTLLTDEFDFDCPFGLLGRLADPVVAAHMRAFLARRNRVIQEVAEGDRWREVLGEGGQSGVQPARVEGPKH